MNLKAKKIILFGVLGLLIIGLTYFIADQLIPKSEVTSKAQMTFSKDGVTPTELTVKKGTSVTFVNNETDDFIVAFTFPGFDTATKIAGESSFSFLYDQVGSYEFSVVESPLNIRGVVFVME